MSLPQIPYGVHVRTNNMSAFLLYHVLFLLLYTVNIHLSFFFSNSQIKLSKTERVTKIELCLCIAYVRLHVCLQILNWSCDDPADC